MFRNLKLNGESKHNSYRIRDLHRVMTPALAIYPEILQTNIEATLKALDNDVNKWRPHVKTGKLAKVILT